jgi:hypothetical protein
MPLANFVPAYFDQAHDLCVVVARFRHPGA